MYKKFRKLFTKLLLTAFSLSTIGIISLSSACGYQPQFYNFENYMSNTAIKIINKDFQYAEYGDVDDFQQLVKDNKTIGGITNIFIIARLIQDGYAQKLWDDNDASNSAINKILGTNIQDIATLKKMYTPAVQKYLDFYNSNFLSNENIYEYLVPYFFQEKVIAINLDRGGKTGKKIDFPDLSWPGILKTLSENGYKNLGVNNYFTDNMMIGSTIGENNVGLKTMQGTYTYSNYKQFANRFAGMIDTYFPNDEHQYNTDGADLFLGLIDPNRSLDSAIIYNGDAMDAYYAKNNFPNESNGRIQVVVPQPTMFQLDGTMVVNQKISKVSDSSLNSLYKDLHKGIYQWSDQNPTSSSLYTNFNYVKYTPSFNSIFEYFNKPENFQFPYCQNDNPENVKINDYARTEIYNINEANIILGSVPFATDDQLKALAKIFYNNAILQ